MNLNNDTPALLSIISSTYNHELYIRKCLDGIVSQKTNYTFQAVVHDDASTDNTADIIREYENKYPDIIKPIYQKTNGYGSDRNRDDKLNAIKGSKYIAYCEGDDYWTDPNKLQKQIDFLEKNENFSMCFHKVKADKDGVLVDDFTAHAKKISTIEDLAKGNYIHSCSIVFRNIDYEEGFWDLINQFRTSDYIFNMFNAKLGKIYCFDEYMSVYRYGVGTWSTVDGLIRQEQWIELCDNLIPYFDENVQVILKDQIYSILYSTIEYSLINKNDTILDIISKNPAYTLEIIRYLEVKRQSCEQKLHQFETLR